MRLSILLPTLLILAGCATGRPYAPVRDVRYSALGENPFWMVTIGDDKIVLTLGGRGQARLDSQSYPRVLPQTDGNVTRWQSGEGIGAITITARNTPTPCESGARQFED